MVTCTVYDRMITSYHRSRI